jgi:predicted CXXCH cytochrome family protein
MGWMATRVIQGTVLLLLLSGGLSADAQGIMGTRHDLAVPAAPGGEGAEVCMFCHTRQGPDGPVRAPVWTRGRAYASFAVYDGPASDGTFQAAGSAAGNSLVCLSCHDGSIAPDIRAERPGAPAVTGHARVDHPVGVVYALAQGPSSAPGGSGPGFVPASGDSINGELPLYDGSVQCATCHDPHMHDRQSFLRKSNAGSALCLTCHRKNVSF